MGGYLQSEKPRVHWQEVLHYSADFDPEQSYFRIFTGYRFVFVPCSGSLSHPVCTSRSPCEGEHFQGRPIILLAGTFEIILDGKLTWQLSDLAAFVTEKAPRKNDEAYFECQACGNLWRTAYESKVRCKMCDHAKCVWIPDRVVDLTNRLREHPLPIAQVKVKRGKVIVVREVAVTAVCAQCPKSFVKVGRSRYCSDKCKQSAAYNRRVCKLSESA
jgi:hypothetical protein